MNDIFSFLNHIGNYESRKVLRNDFPEGFVSTCYVSDGSQPFETAICHKDYQSEIIPVEAYNTIEEAEVGHARWVEMFINKTLPERLIEFPNSAIAQLLIDTKGVKRGVKRDENL